LPVRDQPTNWSVCAFDATIKRSYPQAPTTNCTKVNVPMDWAHPDAHPDVQVTDAKLRTWFADQTCHAHTR
jgi:hypothetical protein